MASHWLVVIALTATGIGAGVLTAITISVFPALCAMPRGRYVEAHRMLGKGFHPVMPIVFNVGMSAAFGLAITEPGLSRWFMVAGGVALLASQCVSHLGNVPINRRLNALDPLQIPQDWSDPRPRWRLLNRVRTGLAVTALVLVSSGAALL